ncbi:protein FAM161A [Myripristis murdjan]|uniref:protein FAM161A n=1 Tax=Myripristis murdjan TaxID=586833 RepID=UPI0011760FFB|nr:protein FAM161A [Myripristis murdjan]
MANAHRTNVLVTSCLKTPVDPHTKVPLALYERERALPYTAAGQMDNRDYEKEIEYGNSGSEFSDEGSPRRSRPLRMKDYRVSGDRINLSEIFFSNEEYYSKLEDLKKAHLRTMAELEGMYRKKLQLKSSDPLDTTLEAGNRPLWAKTSPAASYHLRKAHSALELRGGSEQVGTSDEEGAAANYVEKGLLSSPKEHIKNMWRDFRLSPNNLHLSSSSLQSLPGDQKRRNGSKGRVRKRDIYKDLEQDSWKHKVTVPEPFQMMLREAERRRRGIKTRSEIEMENAELRRQLEELTECQRKFRASPVPAHVHLPLYEELQERDEERRRTLREREEQHLRTIQKPFSFLERERLKKEKKEEELRQVQSAQEEVKPFKANPVPKAVYIAASGEQMKEEQLYRSIKMQMRAKEMLCSASMPPSMLARRLSERKTKDTATAAEGDESFSHRPQINKDVPDFSASYRRFQRQLESRKEVRPVTACEPFNLRTSQIPSHRERILADIEKEQSSPRPARWPYLSPNTRTPNSSLCSSLSSSLELLPTKATDATKKRQEAVRKVLEQRKKAEEEEETWRERQKQRERKLQKLVLKRAQANDPHLALSQAQPAKLKEFRKQDLLRKKEYRQEIKEIQERVKGRPLLLEQVAQRNAKQRAEKRYTDKLRSCDLTEDFVRGKVAKSQQPGRSGSARKSSFSSDSRLSDREEADLGYEPVRFRKVYLDDEDVEAEEPEEAGGEQDGEDAAHYSDDHHDSDNSYHYSDDHEDYSDDSEHSPAPGDRKQERDVIRWRRGNHSDRSSPRSRNSQRSDREDRADKASEEED